MAAASAAEPNMNTNYLVRNRNGTGKNKCKCCGDWKKHYIANTNSKRTTCAVLQCNGTFDVGAHVDIVDKRSSDAWFIAPFCHGCNKRVDDLWLKADTKLCHAALKDCDA